MGDRLAEAWERWAVTFVEGHRAWETKQRLDAHMALHGPGALALIGRRLILGKVEAAFRRWRRRVDAAGRREREAKARILMARALGRSTYSAFHQWRLNAAALKLDRRFYARVSAFQMPVRTTNRPLLLCPFPRLLRSLLTDR